MGLSQKGEKVVKNTYTIRGGSPFFLVFLIKDRKTAVTFKRRRFRTFQGYWGGRGIMPDLNLGQKLLTRTKSYLPVLGLY